MLKRLGFAASSKDVTSGYVRARLLCRNVITKIVEKWVANV